MAALGIFLNELGTGSTLINKNKDMLRNVPGIVHPILASLYQLDIIMSSGNITIILVFVLNYFVSYANYDCC
jgi:hypothetical protein